MLPMPSSLYSAPDSTVHFSNGQDRVSDNHSNSIYPGHTDFFRGEIFIAHTALPVCISAGGTQFQYRSVRCFYSAGRTFLQNCTAGSTGNKRLFVTGRTVIRPIPLLKSFFGFGFTAQRTGGKILFLTGRTYAYALSPDRHIFKIIFFTGTAANSTFFQPVVPAAAAKVISVKINSIVKG